MTENYQEKKLQVTGPGSGDGTLGNKTKNRARSYTIVSGAGLDKMKHRLQSQVIIWCDVSKKGFDAMRSISRHAAPSLT